MHSFFTGFSLRELTNFHYNTESAFGLGCYLYLACIIMLENFFNLLHNYINYQRFSFHIRYSHFFCLRYHNLLLWLLTFHKINCSDILATVDITSFIYWMSHCVKCMCSVTLGVPKTCKSWFYFLLKICKIMKSSVCEF